MFGIELASEYEYKFSSAKVRTTAVLVNTYLSTVLLLTVDSVCAIQMKACVGGGGGG